jgi:hypothetical protein
MEKQPKSKLIKPSVEELFKRMEEELYNNTNKNKEIDNATNIKPIQFDIIIDLLESYNILK